MYNNGEEYIPPDYSTEDQEAYDQSPEEDDDIEEFDEGLEEKFVEEQERLNEKQQQNNRNIMENNSSPFGAPKWGSSQQSTPWGNSQQPPWQQRQYQQTTAPQFNNWQSPFNNGVNTWNQGGPWQQNNGARNNAPTTAIRVNRPKDIVIVDLLDGLIESWNSEGKPNIPPRDIYDVRLKFESWDAIASLSPKQVFIVYSVPYLNEKGREDWDVVLKYIALALSNYLRIPSFNVIVVRKMIEGQSKEVALRCILDQIPDERRKSLIYTGVYSGYYKLGNGDLSAANNCGIEYADIYQLIRGEI